MVETVSARVSPAHARPFVELYLALMWCAASYLQDILKRLTVNSLILSVNLQELRPRADPAAHQGPAHQLTEQLLGTAGAQGYSRVVETPAGPQVLTGGLSMGQAGALGLVSLQIQQALHMFVCSGSSSQAAVMQSSELQRVLDILMIL